MVVDEHGIQPFEVVIVPLLLLLILINIFVITSAHPSLHTTMSRQLTIRKTLMHFRCSKFQLSHVQHEIWDDIRTF